MALSRCHGTNPEEEAFELSEEETMRSLKVISVGLAALGIFMISAPLAEATPDPRTNQQVPADSTMAALDSSGGYIVQVQRPEQAMVTADLSVSADSTVSLAEDGSLLMESPTSSELIPAVLDLGAGRRATGTWELVSSTHAIYSASVSTKTDSGSNRVMSSFDWDCNNERIRDGFITGTIGGCIAGSAGGCMVGGVSGAFGGAVTGLIDCW